MSLVIGITGGIASGKSTLTSYLRQCGYQVEDSDLIAKQGYDDCFEAIQHAFPQCVNKTIDTKRLAHLVFNDEAALKQLNAILHPYVRKQLLSAIQACQDDIIFIDVPLLFEAGFDDLCDEIWCVIVDETIQLTRLMQRNHLSETEAKLRIQSQWPMSLKASRSDVVFENNTTIEDLYQKVKERLVTIHA